MAQLPWITANHRLTGRIRFRKAWFGLGPLVMQVEQESQQVQEFPVSRNPRTGAPPYTAQIIGSTNLSWRDITLMDALTLGPMRLTKEK